MPKKHICKACNYETGIHSNYLKHLKTKTHSGKLTEPDTLPAAKIDDRSSKNDDRASKNAAKKSIDQNSKKGVFECEYCQKVLSYKYHLKRHYLVCKEREKIELEKNKDIIIKSLKEENKLVIKRLQKEKEQLLKDKEHALKQIVKEKTQLLKDKENAFKKVEEMTKLKEKAEQNYIDELKEFRAGVKSGSITVNNTSNVNIGKLNVYYVVKNYNDAYNYEDLMEPELTKAEIRHTRNYGPSAGCERLIMNRCVNGIAKDKRPIHCVDASREKFMVKTNGEWELDVDKDQILQPAFAHMRTQYDISDDNKDIIDKVNNLQLLQKMDTVGGKKTIKNLVKRTLLKNKE